MTSDPLGLLTPLPPKRRPWLIPVLVVAVLVAGGLGFGAARYFSTSSPAASPTTAPPSTTAAAATTKVRLPPALSCTLAAPPATDLADLVNAYFEDRKVDDLALLKLSTELSRVALLDVAEPLEKPLVDLSHVALELAANGEGATGVPFNSALYYGSIKKIVDFCLPYSS